MQTLKNRIEYESHRLGRSRFGLLVAGVALVAVPTLFTIFPSWGKWTTWHRSFVAIGWLLVAAFVVGASVRQSSQMDRLVGEALERQARQRFLAGSRILEALLKHATGFPPHYEFRLFLPDIEKTGRLIASYEPDGQDAGDGWVPGCGAVGVAWEQREYVEVHGAACSDGTWKLTEEQQQRYKDLQVVAAMPVRNARDQPIAILAASSDSDDGQLTSPQGREKHKILAEVVSRVLVDILSGTLGADD